LLVRYPCEEAHCSRARRPNTPVLRHKPPEAIYHFTAEIVKRKDGRSVVGVAHSEILAPDGASDWVDDRFTLWNTVDAVETRKDAQLARDIEVGLPIELTKSELVALARDFTRRAFVAKGMVADFAVHLGITCQSRVGFDNEPRTGATDGGNPKRIPMVAFRRNQHTKRRLAMLPSRRCFDPQ
jgi:hypothetical protein